MRSSLRFLTPLSLVLGALLLPSTAMAHPEACDGGVKGASAAFNFLDNGFFGPGDDDGQDTCFTREQVAAFDDSDATLGVGETARTKNMHHLANLPQTGPFADDSTNTINSDIAFWGKYAFQGNYQGFQITDISDPEDPSVVSQVNCPGSQNDISVWRNLVILSTDSRRTDNSCNSSSIPNATLTLDTEYWEGLKIFDWSNPASPQLVGTVETDCGSHTHTIVPDGNRLLVYVSSYDLFSRAKDCRDTGSKNDHDKISIVEVPLSNPAGSSVIAEPNFWPDGGQASGTGRATAGCHDITVFPAIDKAAGACMGEGILFDISNPAAPTVISRVWDPNFAFWHSATFFNNGKKVLFTDELGGGTQPMCNPTLRQNQGADIIYDISNPASPKFLSYFKIDRTQDNTENCVAHNGNFIPTSKGDTYVQAWYQGGTSVIDMSDARNPEEVGFFERGPFRTDAGQPSIGGSWSSYYYNGFIYSNDIQEGLDVFKFSDRRGAGAGRNKMAYLNAQVQEPLRK